MNQKTKSKKKMGLFLFVILCLQLLFVNQNLVINGELLQPIENEYSINNIGLAYYSYEEMLMNDTLVYLYDNDVIDIMNISNLKDIKKESSINLDAYLSIDENTDDAFYDWENNSIYYYDYDYYDRIFNVTAYHYNNTHVTETKTNSCNISANYTIFRNHQIYQSENTLYIVMYDRNQSSYIGNITIQINLLTFDITNKTQPEILAPPVLLYNATGLEEWGETDRYSVNRNTFSFYDNNLYLVRAYLSHEDIDGFYHPDETEFSYGYIKAWDLSNASNPEDLFTVEIDQWDFSNVIISGNLMFYKSSSGFQLYNISDFNNIQYLSDYYADDGQTQIIFSDNLYYLICYRSIQILDITDPKNIKKIGQYKVIFQGNGGFHKGILKEKILYLTRSSEYEDRCFFVIDCSNSKNPKKLFPLGNRLSKETLWQLAVSSMIIGPIIGVIIIITVTVLLVRRRKRKKSEKIEVSKD